MDLQLSNAVSHIILRGLVIFKTFIEFWTFLKSKPLFQKWKNILKYRQFLFLLSMFYFLLEIIPKLDQQKIVNFGPTHPLLKIEMRNSKVSSSYTFLLIWQIIFCALPQRNSKIFPIRIIYQLKALIFYFGMSKKLISEFRCFCGKQTK